MYVIRIMVRLWSTRTTRTHLIAFWVGRRRTSRETSILFKYMYWNKNIESDTNISVFRSSLGSVNCGPVQTGPLCSGPDLFIVFRSS